MHSVKTAFLSLILVSQISGVSANAQGQSQPSRFGGARQSLSMRNGLPPTRMDSFVKEAYHEKDHIYGDEGVDGLPPYYGFSKVHRINNGIFDTRDQGLTTGHASYLQDAWGADEFLMPPGEWDMSGPSGRTAGAKNEDAAPGGSGSGLVKPPYQIGSHWMMVRNTHNGQIMGWMAPGETFEDFFSGRSGHLLAGWEKEGRYILENQLPMLRR